MCKTANPPVVVTRSPEAALSLQRHLAQCRTGGALWDSTRNALHRIGDLALTRVVTSAALLVLAADIGRHWL